MKSRLLDPDAPEWEGFLHRVEHDVYHLPGYARASALHERGMACAAYVEDQAGFRLLLPLIIRDLGGGHRDAVSPSGYPGPIADTDAPEGVVHQAMSSVVELLRSESIVALFVRLHPLIPVRGLDGIGTFVRHGDTVVVDLGLSEDDLWNQTRHNHRRDIRRALRAGAVFAFERTPEAFGAFKELYRATMARHGATERYAFDDSYFDMLLSALDTHLHLATVRLDGSVIAAGLFTRCRDIVQLHLAGFDDACASLRPTKLLYHGVRSWAKHLGFQWFHLGGGVGAETDSLLHFKAGFSPLRCEFRTWRVVVRDEDYRSLTAARAAHVDPDDTTGFFPAYLSERGPSVPQS